MYFTCKSSSQIAGKCWGSHGGLHERPLPFHKTQGHSSGGGSSAASGKVSNTSLASTRCNCEPYLELREPPCVRAQGPREPGRGIHATTCRVQNKQIHIIMTPQKISPQAVDRLLHPPRQLRHRSPRDRGRAVATGVRIWDHRRAAHAQQIREHLQVLTDWRGAGAGLMQIENLATL